jgi:DNA-binding winged helix-turn-helix (wHTH) protein
VLLSLNEPAYRDDPPTTNRQTDLVAGERTLAFGRFRALPRRRQLLADGRPVELGGRAFDILLALLEADGLLVTKDELLSRVWAGRIVGENNLHAQMSALRKALGEDRDLIRTDCGRGYRLTVPVRMVAPPSACPDTARRSKRADRRAVRPHRHRPMPLARCGWWAAGWRRP